MADRITYEDKVAIIPREVHINQVWDIDMNNLKKAINNHALNIEYLKDGNGQTYESIADAMAVIPLPANNTPFTVRGSVSEDGYYIYLSSEPGGYKLLEYNDLDLNATTFKVIPNNFDFTAIPIGYDNSVWIITYEHDLLTNTIVLPTNVTLNFKGGKLSNGNVTLDNTFIQCDDTSCLDVSLSGICLNTELNINHLTLGHTHIETMQTGSKVNLLSNINVPTSFDLKCSIYGGNKTITSLSGQRLILLQSDNVTIKDTKLLIDNDVNTLGSFGFSIYSDGYGNFNLINSDVLNGSLRFQNIEAKFLGHINIDNCNINIDHTNTLQDTYSQHDGLIFRGIKYISIKNTDFNITNVNRVFKFADAIYTDANLDDYYCDFIEIDNCRLVANSSNGKQVMDLYDRTGNLTINNCDIEAIGHTTLVENKTNLYSPNNKKIIVKNSKIVTDWMLGYFYTNDEMSVEFVNNDIRLIQDSVSRDILENGVLVNQTKLYTTSVRSCNFIFSENKVISNIYRVESIINIRETDYVKINDNHFENLGKLVSCETFNKTLIIENNQDNDITISSTPPIRIVSAIETLKIFNNTLKRGTLMYVDASALIDNCIATGNIGNNYIVINTSSITDFYCDGTLKRLPLATQTLLANETKIAYVAKGDTQVVLNTYKYVGKTNCLITTNEFSASNIRVTIFNPNAVGETVDGEIFMYKNRTIG